VEILPVIGAGASLLSKGFVPAAQRHAESVLEAIRVRDGGAAVPVVGCEPPEVACLKHEYAALIPSRREEIRSLSARTWQVEEFLLRSNVINDLRVANMEMKTSGDATKNKNHEKITLHPHCHQRAEPPADDGLPTGPLATAALLREFGFDVEVMDAGCCGMAGTFGYDHYELSMQVGELGVLPKARAAENLVSTGAACRMQIKQGAGRDAVHPLVLLRDRLRLR
jgi:Fe-S oxidoreductase